MMPKDSHYGDSTDDDPMDIEFPKAGGGPPEVIKVSANSRATAVAGAVAGVIRDYGEAEVQAVGAGAVNQAVKALAIARGYLERDGLDISFRPYFIDVDIEGHERTAVRFQVEWVERAT
jgi:stage V sporulation protein S